MAEQHQGVVPASGLEIIERHARSTQAAMQELLGCSAVRHDDINAGNPSVFVMEPLAVDPPARRRPTAGRSGAPLS